jgi:hypothetical protein
MQTSPKHLAGIAIDPAINGLTTSMVDSTLHAFKVVVVVVDTSWRCELAFLHIDGLVSFAVACCSLLMSLVARQRARAGLAPWAAIFWLFREASRVSAINVEMLCKVCGDGREGMQGDQEKAAYQMVHNSDRSASSDMAILTMVNDLAAIR